MLKVFICYTNILIRAGWKQLLGDEYRDIVFGEAETATQALFQVERNQWDVAIFELAESDNDGFDAIVDIRRRRPSIRILAHSGFGDSEWVAHRVVRTGSTYISKNASRSELLTAFKSAVAGRAHLDQSPAKMPPASTLSMNRRLSPREHQVLLAVASGKRMVEIASEWKVSVKTVSTYKRRVLDKLDLKSGADLVRYATKMKIA